MSDAPRRPSHPNRTTPAREQSPVPTRLPPETTLLCESCGYDIESLPHAGNCPECGRAIATSLPAARPGSPWQHHPSLRSLLTTWLDTLRKPRQVFDAINLDKGPRRLLGLTLLASSALVVTAAYFFLRGRTARDFVPVDSTLIALAWAYSAGTITLAALVLLTLIENRGIRFWGPRKGWRITPAVADVVCAHASVGWLLGAVLAIAGHALGLFFLGLANRHNLGIFRGPFQLAPITLPALGFLAGMIGFEVLVYVGMSRMKFANRERPPEP